MALDFDCIFLKGVVSLSSLLALIVVGASAAGVAVVISVSHASAIVPT